VATRLHFPFHSSTGSLGTFTTAGRFQCHETVFYTPDYEITDLRLFFPAFYTLTTGTAPTETAGPNNKVIEGVSVLINDTLPWRSLAFSGSAGVTVAPATNSVGHWTDALTGVPISANSKLRVRIAFNGTVNDKSWQGMTRRTSLGEGSQGSSSSLAAKLTDNSSLNGSNVLNSSIYGPAMAVGRGRPSGKAVYVIVGDSIGAGANTPESQTDARGNRGYIQRGVDATTGGRCAYLDLTCPGIRPSEWQNRSGWSRRLDALALLPNIPFTHVLSQLGTNGVGNAAFMTDLLPKMQAYWNLLKTEWNKPITQLELLPRPTSTDGYATTSNQRTQTDAAADKSSKYYTGNVAAIVAAQPHAQRWAFNCYVGGLNGTSSPANDARAAGYITDSIAPWKYVSADTGANRDLWALRPFTTTVVSHTGGSSTIVFNAAPAVGEYISLLDGAAARLARIVLSVTGTGPYTVTLDQSITSAVPANNIVTAMMSDNSGLHPGTIPHSDPNLLPKALTDWKQGIRP
jgi:hypothetical protein